MNSADRGPLYKVRNSKIHGRGVFAARRIRKGTRVIEYVGERVSHAEADRRYEHKAYDDNHTFLFIVDARTVIDAGVGGNTARLINHSCNRTARRCWTTAACSSRRCARSSRRERQITGHQIR